MSSFLNHQNRNFQLEWTKECTNYASKFQNSRKGYIFELSKAFTFRVSEIMTKHNRDRFKNYRLSLKTVPYLSNLVLEIDWVTKRNM